MPCAILRAFPLPHRFIVSFPRSPRRAAIIPHRLGIRPTFILLPPSFFTPPCDLYSLRENPLLFETHRTRITSRKMHFKITFVSKRDERLRHAAHVIDSHENGTSFIRVRPNLSRQRERKRRERGDIHFREISNRCKYIQ